MSKDSCSVCLTGKATPEQYKSLKENYPEIIQNAVQTRDGNSYNVYLKVENTSIADAVAALDDHGHI